jgi:hypothetical protein
LAQLSKRVRGAGRPGTAKRRTVVLTPKRRAQLELQGAYMGYLRQLKPPQNAQIRR